MSRVAFLMYHGQGHFNPVFRLAKILQPSHEVVFAGVSFFKSYVENQGFRHYSLRTVPFGLGFETWVNAIEKKKHIYWGAVKDRWTNRLFELRKLELTQMLDDLRPDYLLIDSTQSTDFIVLYHELRQRAIRTALIHANLAPELEPDLPPLNSPLLPGNVADVNWSHRIFFLRQLKRSVHQWLKYFGRSDKNILHRQIIHSQIPSKYISVKLAIFSPAIDNIDQLILAPKEFEFPSNHRSSFQHFLGFMIDTQRSENDDPYFEVFYNEIQKWPERALIYCSFGTVAYDDMKKVKTFLRRLVSVVDASAYSLVISGNAHDLLKEQPLPPNVYVFKSVPNFRLLPRTAVFITHGGFNSIKESIHAGVPLLVYPVDDRTDQPGNSARILYHGLGLRGKLESDPEKMIGEKIKDLIQNPVYRENLLKLKEIDSKYTEENFLKVFQQIGPVG
jgi:zeaxanthin glucosyltransferase